MANFQVAPKMRVVNSPDQFIISTYAKKANGAFEPAEVTADVDLLKIEGFAELYAENIVSGSKTLSIPGQKQQGKFTFTTGTVVANEEVSIEVIAKSFNTESEFARFDGKDQKSRFYDFHILAGDTPTKIAQRLKGMLDQDVESGVYQLIDATQTAGVVSYTSKNEGWAIDVKITGSAIDSGAVSLSHTIDAPAYEGRGVYRQMNVKRLQNPNRTYPYSAGHYGANNEVPSPGGTYSCVMAKFKVVRTDLSGPSMQNDGPVTGEYELEVYFLDGAVDAERDAFVAWLKAHANVFEEYNATTAAAAVVEEVPVVTTN